METNVSFGGTMSFRLAPRFLALLAGLVLLAFTTSNHGASVTLDGDCQLLGSFSGLTVLLNSTHLTGYQKVISPSGSARLTCHFAIPDEHLPDEVLINHGDSCLIDGLGSTTNTKSLATPGGHAMLVCISNPSES